MAGTMVKMILAQLIVPRSSIGRSPSPFTRVIVDSAPTTDIHDSSSVIPQVGSSSPLRLEPDILSNGIQLRYPC